MLLKGVQQTSIFSKNIFLHNIIMESLSLEEVGIIKDIRDLSRIKQKELTYTAIKHIRNLFRQERETKAFKDRILRDIKNVFEHEEGE